MVTTRFDGTLGEFVAANAAKAYGVGGYKTSWVRQVLGSTCASRWAAGAQGIGTISEGRVDSNGSVARVLVCVCVT